MTVLELKKKVGAIESRLDSREEVLDLRLQNLENELKLHFQSVMNKVAEDIKKDIDSKIESVFASQKEKISWGLEVLRFLVMAATFVISVRML